MSRWTPRQCVCLFLQQVRKEDPESDLAPVPGGSASLRAHGKGIEDTHGSGVKQPRGKAATQTQTKTCWGAAAEN